MLNATHRYAWFLLLVIWGMCGFYSLLSAAELDRTDPNAVANAFLLYIQTDDYNNIMELMYPEQKEEYQAMAAQGPQELQRIFSKFKEHTKGILAVEEFRQMTTFSGRDGLAGLVKKVGGEVFVLILAKEENLYYYDSCMMLTQKSYKELAPFTK